MDLRKDVAIFKIEVGIESLSSHRTGRFIQVSGHSGFDRFNSKWFLGKSRTGKLVV